jgi:predicted GNAT family acetyltransferase
MSGGTVGCPSGLGPGMEPIVQDVPESSRYEIRDGDRVLGLAAYRREAGRTVFTHTEVYPEAEGTGVGGTLVRGALDDVRARGERVVPQCSFVRGWIERHADYADLVDAS